MGNYNKKLRLLSISIGLVYLWFGGLKFFPGLSPAEDLAKATIDFLTFAIIPSNVSIILLAIIEVAIGIMLIFNLYQKTGLQIALVHIIITFVPFFFFTELIFSNIPFGFSLLGQYIFKNVVIIAALLLLLQSSKKAKKATP